MNRKGQVGKLMLKSRRKIAVIACARRLLIRCWAMLRDGTDWRIPEPVAAT